MSKEYVHFTLGDNAGKLLVDIAREKIIYKHKPNEGLDVIMGSLIGCPKRIALDIIKGKAVLETAKDGTSFNVSAYHPDMKEKYPPFDIEGWSENTLLQMKEIAREWEQAILDIRRMIIRKEGSFDIEVRYQELVKYFYSGDCEDILDVDNNDDICHIKNVVVGAKSFIAECYEKMEVIQWLANAYPDDIPEGFLLMPLEVTALNGRLVDIMLKDSEIENYIARNLYRDDLVMRYIANEKEIEKVIQHGIMPVDIADNYSAGWLAPNGDFYGLNGEIANMLHNQIATALYDKGIIPKADEDGWSYERNPDGWLSRNGWIKIHGDHVLYDGYMQSQYGMPLVRITKAQKDQLVKYGQTCHRGSLKFGLTYRSVPVETFAALPDQYIGQLFDLNI